MKALVYILWRSLINQIRRLRQKPGQLVLVILMVAMMGFVIFASTMDYENPAGMPDAYKGAVMTLAVLLAAWFTVKNGLDKGSSFYRMADVNFVFPAPIRPRHILLYGFVHQLGISLLTLAFLLFQMVNVRNLFGVGMDGMPAFYIGVFLILLYMPVVSMLIYSRALSHPERKVRYRRLFTGVMVVLGGAYVVTAIAMADPLAAAAVVFDNSAVNYIPIIGWFRTVLMASVNGWDWYSLLSLGLLVATLAGTLIWLLRSDIDYYEDVLKETERRETLVRNKRAGKANMPINNGRVRRASVQYQGYGASALFYRQMLEYRKSGFLFFDKTSLFLAVAAVVAGYLLRDNPMQAYIMLYGSIYILFIFSFSGKWVRELGKPYIYMIPAPSMARIWYATLANHLKHLADGLVIFVIAGLLSGAHPLTSLLMVLEYTAFGALFIYSDVLFRRFFGTLGNSMAAGFLKLFMVVILALPALALIIATSVFASGSQTLLWLSQAGVGVYAALMSLLVMFMGRRLFENLELAQ